MDTKSGDGGEQEVDLDDADVSAVAEAPRVTAPPPLPPEVAAQASVAPQPPSFSAPPQGSLAPAAPERGRSPMFYVGLLVAFLVVGLVAGAAVMLSRRAPPVAAQAPSAAPAPAVITIPTVHMDDDPDSGT
jgi:hypothetical protein